MEGDSGEKVDKKKVSERDKELIQIVMIFYSLLFKKNTQ